MKRVRAVRMEAGLGWVRDFGESLECKMMMLGLRPGAGFGAEQPGN